MNAPTKIDISSNTYPAPRVGLYAQASAGLTFKLHVELAVAAVQRGEATAIRLIPQTDDDLDGVIELLDPMRDVYVWATLSGQSSTVTAQELAALYAPMAPALDAVEFANEPTIDKRDLHVATYGEIIGVQGSLRDIIVNRYVDDALVQSLGALPNMLDHHFYVGYPEPDPAHLRRATSCVVALRNESCVSTNKRTGKRFEYSAYYSGTVPSTLDVSLNDTAVSVVADKEGWHTGVWECDDSPEPTRCYVHMEQGPSGTWQSIQVAVEGDGPASERAFLWTEPGWLEPALAAFGERVRPVLDAATKPQIVGECGINEPGAGGRGMEQAVALVAGLAMMAPTPLRAYHWNGWLREEPTPVSVAMSMLVRVCKSDALRQCTCGGEGLWALASYDALLVANTRGARLIDVEFKATKCKALFPDGATRQTLQTAWELDQCRVLDLPAYPTATVRVALPGLTLWTKE